MWISWQCPAFSLAVVFGLAGAWSPLAAYPIADGMINLQDVDKTHTGADALGGFTGIPSKEILSCWLASSASVIADVTGNAKAQSLHADLLKAFSGDVPAAPDPEFIADYLNGYFRANDIRNFRASWSLIADPDWTRNDDAADAMFCGMLDDALDGDRIILTVLRDEIYSGDDFGHATAIDGWIGFRSKGTTSGILGVVDSQGDWLDRALGRNADSMLFTRSYQQRTVNGVTGWLPRLDYSSQSGQPPDITDWMFGYVSVHAVPEPATLAMAAAGLTALAAAVRRRRSVRSKRSIEKGP